MNLYLVWNSYGGCYVGIGRPGRERESLVERNGVSAEILLVELSKEEAFEFEQRAWELGCSFGLDMLNKQPPKDTHWNYGCSATPEVRERLRQDGLQRTFSAETRTKMSLAKLGLKQSPELVAKRIAARQGYRHSAETRAKISKPRTSEAKERYRQAALERERRKREGS